VKREQLLVAEAEKRHAQAVRELDVQTLALEQERQRWLDERAALAASLPAELSEMYQRVARLRGAAVSEARDRTCQQCRMVLRPQMYVEIKRNDQIMQCPSCSRVLYYIPPPPTTDAHP
jgi:predicted  nucleic acid-binding Zn-ribbon protein